MSQQLDASIIWHGIVHRRSSIGPKIKEPLILLQEFNSKNTDSNTGQRYEALIEARDFFRLFGIRLQLTPAYHPQFNGQTERFNRNASPST